MDALTIPMVISYNSMQYTSPPLPHMGMAPRVHTCLKFCYLDAFLFWDTHFKDVQTANVKSLVLQRPYSLMFLLTLVTALGY